MIRFAAFTTAICLSVSMITSAVANDISLQDLMPDNDYSASDQVDLSSPAPEPAPSDYERFDNWVREQRTSDGFGIGYDTDNRAPMITYQDSFE